MAGRHLDLFPARPILDDFTGLADGSAEISVRTCLRNSLICSLGAVAGVLIPCSLTAYAFAKIGFAGRNLLFPLMIGTLLLPYHAPLIPQYVMFQKMQLINSYVPLAGEVPRHADLLRLPDGAVHAAPPGELDEAARIDGCGHLRIYWSIGEKARACVLSTMETIAAQPNGFVRGSGLYDLDTRRFAVADTPKVEVSHRSAVFGIDELCAELIDLVDMPESEQAYYDYCRWFNATRAEQKARYGSDFGTLPVFQGHSRLDAYAAVRTGDTALAQRDRDKFHHSDGYRETAPWRTERISGPAALVEGSEAAWISTDDTALHGLAAVENLAPLGDKMP